MADSPEVGNPTHWIRRDVNLHEAVLEEGLNQSTKVVRSLVTRHSRLRCSFGTGGVSSERIFSPYLCERGAGSPRLSGRRSCCDSGIAG